METENGFHLPNFKIKAISDEYLEGILKKKFFSIAQSSIKTPKIFQKNTIQGLLKLLISELDRTQRKPLGFDDFKPPNNKWLIKVLYSINPDLDILQPDTGLDKYALLSTLEKK